MSRDNCSICSPCKNINLNYCDKCTASCCQENMKKHREIFYLNDNFSSNVNYAENELTDQAQKTKDNLSKDYNINIGYCTCCVSHCEVFLDSMKSKYNEMKNHENSLNNQMKQNETKFENEKIIISNNLIVKLRDINNSCEQKKREITNIKEKKNKDIIKNLTTQKQKKKNLENKKENIKNTNINEIVNDFINGEKPQMELEYQKKKNLIDDKNKISTVNLEYTDEEKNLENYYLSTICNIKNYSKKIPFFDDWMKAYDLNKYIN